MELKPCPFCGSVANVHSVGDGDSYVLCQSCDTLSPKDGTPEYVAQNWNNRPLEDALRAQSVKDAARIAELEEFVKEFADEPCTYGDNCPDFGTRHGKCYNCKARAALAEAGEGL